MTRKSKHKKQRAHSKPRAPVRPDWPVLALSVAGMALTGYLSAVAWLDAELAYCSAGSSCDIVQSSRWSTLLGLPVAFWGFLTYSLLAAVAFGARRVARRWKWSWLISLMALGVSLYLTGVSVFVLEAACVYCLLSVALIAAIFGLVAARRPANLPGFRWRDWLPPTLGASAALVLVLHLQYAGVFDPAAGPEDPRLRALAAHLSESGAKFYGAYWCPHCERQKEMFAASAERLPYVECTPDGRGGPVNLACITQDISDYPTWIIDGKRYTGAMEPGTLARLSDFPWEDAER